MYVLAVAGCRWILKPRNFKNALRDVALFSTLQRMNFDLHSEICASINVLIVLIKIWFLAESTYLTFDVKVND